MSKMEKLPKSKKAAEQFKQLSDVIWGYHTGGRKPYAIVPLHLGFEEFTAFNETLATIDRSLVLVGTLASPVLKLTSEWGERAEIDAHQIMSLETGTIGTSNRDGMEGWWCRDMFVRGGFRLKEGLLTTEHSFQRDSMGVDNNVLIRATAHLSKHIDDIDYEGEEMAYSVLNSEHESALLMTIAEMGRLSIADFWRSQE